MGALAVVAPAVPGNAAKNSAASRFSVASSGRPLDNAVVNASTLPAAGVVLAVGIGVFMVFTDLNVIEYCECIFGQYGERAVQ